MAKRSRALHSVGVLSIVQTESTADGDTAVFIPTFNLNSPQLLYLHTVDGKMYMYSSVSASFGG